MDKGEDYDSRDDSESSYYSESEASSRRRGPLDSRGTYTEESKGVPTPKNKHNKVQYKN